MRILFIQRTISMFRGGGETYALNIAEHLRGLGCEITFITTKPFSRGVKYPIHEFPVEYVPSPYLRDRAQKTESPSSLLDRIRSKKLRKFLQKVYRYLGGKLSRIDDVTSQNVIFEYLKGRKRNYDVVQVFGHSLLASQIVDELKIPVVIRFPGPPDPTNRANILKCNAVIANGDAYLQIKRTITKKVINIPPGIDSNKFHPLGKEIRSRFGMGCCDKLALYVGRFVPVKNIQFLVSTLAEFLRKDPRIKLMLVGEGPVYNDIDKLVKNLNLVGKVLLTGRIPNDILPQYYSAADVFVMVSEYDNFPNSVLEAMACGLPVIATRVGGIPLMTKDGVNGLLVESNDAAGLRKAFLKLINDERLCEEIGRRNSETARTKYDWTVSAKSFFKVYKEILASSS